MRACQFKVKQKKGRITIKEVDLNHVINEERITSDVINVKRNNIGKEIA